MAAVSSALRVIRQHDPVLSALGLTVHLQSPHSLSRYGRTCNRLVQMASVRASERVSRRANITDLSMLNGLHPKSV